MNENFPRKNVFLAVFWLLLGCTAATIVEMQFKVVQRAYDNLILDNRNHYLLCRDLPSGTEVERTVEQHQDIIQQIGQVAPGFVGVEIGHISLRRGKSRPSYLVRNSSTKNCH